jgi:hypothetical protein
VLRCVILSCLVLSGLDLSCIFLVSPLSPLPSAQLFRRLANKSHGIWNENKLLASPWGGGGGGGHFQRRTEAAGGCF